jgi:hypothetical protein
MTELTERIGKKIASLGAFNPMGLNALLEAMQDA